MIKGLKVALIFLVPALSFSAAGLGFDGSTDSSVTNSSGVDLRYTQSDLDGNLTVSYLENGSLIGSSSNQSSEYLVEFNYSTNLTVYNLTAEASNSSSYSNESRQIDLEVDREKPNISSVSHVRNSNGSVSVSFSVSENGSGMEKLELFRIYSGEEKVDSLETGSEGSFELMDGNDEGLYGEALDYRLTAEDSAGNKESYIYDASVFPLDEVNPFLSSVSPVNDSVINNREKEMFRANFSDRLSGLEKLNLSLGNIFKNKTGIGSENSSIELNISELDNQETFEAEMWSVDEAGNSESFTSTFTTDRDAPEFSGEVFPDEQFIQSEKTLGIDVSGEENGQLAKVVCFLEGEELETDRRPNNNGVYSCGDVDPSAYLDGEKTLYAEVYDSVGNSRRVEIGSWIFDTRRPEVESAEIVPENGWDDPEVSLDVRDEASEIDEVQYWFEVYGEREIYDDIPDLKSAEIEFSPSTDGFSDGEHTLRLRVKDRTGKWSNVTELEYSLFKSERPEASLKSDEIEMSSNGSEDFEATLENTGQVGMLSATLNFSGVVRGSEEVGYIPMESSEEIEFEVEALNGTGVYNSTILLESRSLEQEFRVKTVLRATDEEKEALQNRTDKLNKSLTALKQNFTDIEKDRIPENRVEKVRKDIGSFRKSLENAERSIEQGRYYRTAEIIPEIEQKKERAQTSVNSLSRFKNNLQLLIYGIIGLAPVLMISGIYVSRRYKLNVIEKAVTRLKPRLMKPLRFLKSLIPRKGINKIYRDLAYSRKGTKLTIRLYQFKRKIKRLLKGESVEWKGYH